MGSIDELEWIIKEEEKIEKFISKYGGKKLYFPDFYKWIHREKKQLEKVNGIIRQLYE